MRKIILPLIIIMIICPLTVFSQTGRPVGLAVLDFEAIGISETEAKALSEKIRSSISQVITANALEYQLLERSQMDRILAQFEIQNSGCTDISCAVEFGKMLNVDRIVIGSVSRVGSTYMVIGRIVEIETSKTLRSVERRAKESVENVIDIMPLAAHELMTGERLPDSAVYLFQSDSSMAQVTPFQLSLVNPLQLFPEEMDVNGIRFGIYSVNRNVGIIDIGVINLDRGNMTGFQTGIFNKVGGRSKGFQLGYLMCVSNNFGGLQGSLGNITLNRFTGLQLGFLNTAGDMNGIQLGYLFNYARDLRGFQFSLVNIHRNGPYWAKILPFINYSR